MNLRYRVELSQAERCELTAMLSKGKRAARKLKRAQILLAADAGRGDEEIVRTVAVSGSTVSRTKRRFVEGNLERALSEDPRPGAERKLTGKEEALLVATACATPPEGRARWACWEVTHGGRPSIQGRSNRDRRGHRRRVRRQYRHAGRRQPKRFGGGYDCHTDAGTGQDPRGIRQRDPGEPRAVLREGERHLPSERTRR